MENIWGFLLQTLSVSLAALLLLGMKRIFADKLSPRWQYGIWGLLAVRIILPVNSMRYIILPLPLWLETIKTVVEKMLESCYSNPYIPITVRHIVPIIKNTPASVTDIFFLVYAAGVVISLIWHLLSYVRLRILLKRGAAVSEEVNDRIAETAAAYGLKSCPAVCVRGLSSAFICGIFHPVLAVPADMETDEKIILHELLHLRYRDALQSMIWCVLRSLHWCNPLMQSIFYRISNDMEALCDQRVLERLEGEERRQYGVILLNMANEKYARVPGTTSISNGGKNISRRIASIVRFKKYPQGMALVSTCIVIMLVTPTLIGTRQTFGADDFSPSSEYALEQAMAMTRVNRCTTAAGALDTYAKGLILKNGIYLATATSLSRQEELEQQMIHQSLTNEEGIYYLDCGKELDQINPEAGYSIFNLTENSDGSRNGLLVFPVRYFEGTESEERYWEETRQSLKTQDVALIIPVTVRQEDGFWVTEETGERVCSNRYYGDCGYGYYDGDGVSDVPGAETYTQSGEYGTFVIESKVIYEVDNTITNESFFFGSSTSFNLEPKTDAEFEKVLIWTHVKYTCVPDWKENGPQSSYGYQISCQTEDGSWKNCHRTSSSYLEDWNGIHTGGSGEGWNDIGDDLVVLPHKYRVNVFWDGVPVEELIVGEEDGTE